MASAVASEKIGSRIFVKSYDNDPGSTNAIYAGPDGGTTIRYVDMKDYEFMGVMVKPNIVGGGGVTKVELYASATTTFGTATNIKDSGTVAADALDDNVWLELTAEEVAQAGATLRYVAAKVTHATNTDESTVTYVAIPRRAVTGVTATAIT